MNKLSFAACAVLLAACSNLDSVTSRTLEPNTFVARLSTTAPRPAPPNVAEARAAEAAVLSEIEAKLGPESRGPILAALKDTNDGYVTFVKGKTDEWKDRYARFYAARARRQAEERREASIVAARNRGGIPVVVAIAQPPVGTVAAVVRRQLAQPSGLILLGPTATAEILGGAFAAFDQSRQLFGDDLEHDITIGVREVHVTSIDAKYEARLQQLLDRLKNASPRLVEGVGSVKAIDLRSSKLQVPTP